MPTKEQEEAQKRQGEVEGRLKETRLRLRRAQKEADKKRKARDDVVWADKVINQAHKARNAKKEASASEDGSKGPRSLEGEQ